MAYDENCELCQDEFTAKIKTYHEKWLIQDKQREENERIEWTMKNMKCSRSDAINWIDHIKT